MSDDPESTRHRIDVRPEHVAFAGSLETLDEVLAERDKLIDALVEEHPEFAKDEAVMTALLGEGKYIVRSVAPEWVDVVGTVARIQALNSRIVDLELDSDAAESREGGN